VEAQGRIYGRRKEVKQTEAKKKAKEKSSLGASILKNLGNVRRQWIASTKVYPLPCFSEEYDSMGFRGWGSAKNVILKSLGGDGADARNDARIGRKGRRACPGKASGRHKARMTRGGTAGSCAAGTRKVYMISEVCQEVNGKFFGSLGLRGGQARRPREVEDNRV
jgi:hypothetical protein